MVADVTLVTFLLTCPFQSVHRDKDGVLETLSVETVVRNVNFPIFLFQSLTVV